MLPKLIRNGEENQRRDLQCENGPFPFPVLNPCAIPARAVLLAGCTPSAPTLKFVEEFIERVFDY